MTELSVIIPLAPNEAAWQNLLVDLAELPEDAEILFVASEDSGISPEEIHVPQKKVRLLKSASGRANQMNAGALAAKGEFLWFLHADSKFGHDTLSALLRNIQNHPEHLLYFDLGFLNDASRLMCINRWGVHFRSRILKVPFGDQGFCIRKDMFQILGGFPDNVPYGEDHIFVWKARQQGVKLQPVCSTLYTSARKYKKHGWLKTTLLHQYLWVKQAWPQWQILRRERKKGQEA